MSFRPVGQHAGSKRLSALAPDVAHDFESGLVEETPVKPAIALGSKATPNLRRLAPARLTERQQLALLLQGGDPVLPAAQALPSSAPIQEAAAPADRPTGKRARRRAAEPAATSRVPVPPSEAQRRAHEATLRASGTARPDGYDEWSEAKRKAWDVIDVNPNAFYYRHVPPGVKQRVGKWSEDEHNSLISVIGDKPPDGHWGLIAMHVPGRVGYQCRNYYHQLLAAGKLYDPTYMDENGVYLGKKRRDTTATAAAPGSRKRRRATPASSKASKQGDKRVRLADAPGASVDADATIDVEADDQHAGQASATAAVAEATDAALQEEEEAKRLLAEQERQEKQRRERQEQERLEQQRREQEEEQQRRERQEQERLEQQRREQEEEQRRREQEEKERRQREEQERLEEEEKQRQAAARRQAKWAEREARRVAQAAADEERRLARAAAEEARRQAQEAIAEAQRAQRVEEARIAREAALAAEQERAASLAKQRQHEDNVLAAIKIQQLAPQPMPDAAAAAAVAPADDAVATLATQQSAQRHKLHTSFQLEAQRAVHWFTDQLQRLRRGGAGLFDFAVDHVAGAAALPPRARRSKQQGGDRVAAAARAVFELEQVKVDMLARHRMQADSLHSFQRWTMCACVKEAGLDDAGGAVSSVDVPAVPVEFAFRLVGTESLVLPSSST